MRADRHDEANSRFSQYSERAQELVIEKYFICRTIWFVCTNVYSTAES